MPEQKQTKEEEAGPVDLLTKLIDKATTAGGEGSQMSSSSTPVYLIIAGIVMLGFSIMGFMLVRARRKAAKLASDLRKAEEDKVRYEEDSKLADNSTYRLEAANRAAMSMIRINSLKKELDELEKDRDKRAQSLKKVTNWDDLIVIKK